MGWGGVGGQESAPRPTTLPRQEATYLLSYILTALQVMVPIGEDLRLHDGHDAVLWGEGQSCYEAPGGLYSTCSSSSSSPQPLAKVLAP